MYCTKCISKLKFSFIHCDTGPMSEVLDSIGQSCCFNNLWIWKMTSRCQLRYTITKLQNRHRYKKCRHFDKITTDLCNKTEV